MIVVWLEGIVGGKVWISGLFYFRVFWIEEVVEEIRVCVCERCFREDCWDSGC